MSIENISSEKQKDNNEQSHSLEKRVFWHYARQRLEEMRLLFRAGRLSKKEGDWNNVIDHCLIAGAAADVFTSMLGVPENESEKIQKVVFVHDWKKRLERKPEDFTDEQKMAAEEFLKQVAPDPEILSLSQPGFVREILDGRASLSQKIMFYIDDIINGSEIVGYEQRINETRKRTHFDEDAELTKRLGGKLWDLELQACSQLEQEFFTLLRERGIEIDSPHDIPQLIKNEVIKEIHFIEKEKSDF